MVMLPRGDSAVAFRERQSPIADKARHVLEFTGNLSRRAELFH
jgi:hypothetical protein